MSILRAAPWSAAFSRRFGFVALVAFCIWHSTPATEISTHNSHFTIDGKPTFLLGISYYGALGAPTNFIAADLDDIQRDHFNWLRVWATWSSGGEDISAI